MKANQILNQLKTSSVDYLLHEHPPLFTVEQAMAYDEKMPGGHCKNMLVTNKKRTRYVLIILESHKRMDFKSLGHKIGIKGLKFAKEETLERFDTFSGSVSPFIVLEDHDGEIDVYIDKDLLEYDRLNFHPNINTLTVGVNTQAFKSFMEKANHEMCPLQYP